jgi:DNA polymerase V
MIARSPEVKSLGIPMGIPLFKIKDEVEKFNIKVLAFNSALYGDVSYRVMQVFAQFLPDLEVYSIDEALLGLDGFSQIDLLEYAQQIRARILQWIELTIVSVGKASPSPLLVLLNLGVCTPTTEPPDIPPNGQNWEQ